jgi:hypothetical protein
MSRSKKKCKPRRKIVNQSKPKLTKHPELTEPVVSAESQSGQESSDSLSDSGQFTPTSSSQSDVSETCDICTFLHLLGDFGFKKINQ